MIKLYDLRSENSKRELGEKKSLLEQSLRVSFNRKKTREITISNFLNVFYCLSLKFIFNTK